MGILEGRKALITGCNRGLGREMLELFASEGADIVACSRHRDDAYREDMDSVAGKYGARIFPVFMDLADAASVREALREVGRDHKDVSVLVNNAGIAFNASFFMTPSSKLRELFEVDFFAQVEIMQSVARLMMRGGRGSIISIASAGAVEGGPGYLAYGSAKAALIYATKVLAREAGRYGVRANALAPGLADTAMGHVKPEAEIAKVLARTALGRMAEPSEIARCALFLASDASSFVTGQVLLADGGRQAW